MRSFLAISLSLLLTMFGAKNVFAQSPTFTVTVNTYGFDCSLAAASVKVQGGVPPYQYQWSHGAIGDSISSLNPGNYTITIYDSNSPANDTTVNFTINPQSCKVTFNNRFTPNQDGINDTWGAGGTVRNYPKFLLQVFDRWGQLVHQQKGEYIPWDGTHLGVKVPDATYYYIFFYEEGKTKEYEKGDVTIAR